MATQPSSVSVALADLVARLGEGIADRPEDLEAQLLDLCANGSPREISTIVTAAREGIPRKLLGSRSAPFSVVSSVLARRWAGQSGIEESFALWAVTAWAKALGIPTSPDSAQQTTDPKPDEQRQQQQIRQEDRTQPKPQKPQIKADEPRNTRKSSRANLYYIAAAVVVFALVAWTAFDRSNRAEATTALHDGDLARAAGKYDEAVSDYKKVERLDPGNVNAWIGEGRVYTLQEHYAEALDPLSHALTLDSMSEPAHYYYGYALEWLGRYTDAKGQLEAAAALDPRDYKVFTNLAYNQYELAQYSAAFASAKHALSIANDHPALAIACKSGYRLNDGGAYQLCKAAVQYTTDDYYLWQARGWTIVSGRYTSEYSSAQSAFQKSIDLNKNDRYSMEGLGSVDIYLRDYDDALTAIDTGLNLFPQDAQLWNDRGVALYYLGRYSDAYQSYRKAIALNPNDAITRSNIQKLVAAYPYVTLMP